MSAQPHPHGELVNENVHHEESDINIRAIITFVVVLTVISLSIQIAMYGLLKIFDKIEEWTKTKTKFEAMDILNEHDIPCGPILSMKEIAEEPSLRKTGTVVEVDHPTRGKYLTVGNPIKMSDSPSDVKRSPLLGEHTDEILTELGFGANEIADLRAGKVI